MKYLIVIIAHLWFVLGSLQENDSCMTPCNKPGKCIPWRNCKTVADIMAKESKTTDDIAYLKASKCGATPGPRSTLMACCPPELNPKDCGVVDLANRIIGGEPTKLEEHPWAGLLIYDTGNVNIFFQILKRLRSYLENRHIVP